MKTMLFRSGLGAALMASVFAMSSARAGGEVARTRPPRPLAVELGAPFHDNAILQRGMKVPVWGWTEPGDTITVEFAGQKRVVKAGEDGKFMIPLDPMKASFEPRTMTVTSSIGNRQSTIGNVLVGEVWMASGQSNMEEPAKNSNVGTILLPNILQRVKDGKEELPVIREARVFSTKFSLSFKGYEDSPYPVERARGHWSDGTDLSEYSSIPLAFAYELYRELKVPIGILNCSVGATGAEAWIPIEGLENPASPHARRLRKRWLLMYPGTPENQEGWNKYYQEVEFWIEQSKARMKRRLAPGSSPQTPGNLQNERFQSFWMYNGMMNPMVPYAIRGAIWNQGYNNRSSGLRYYDALVCLISGWRKVWDRPDLPVYLHQYVASSGNEQLSLDPGYEMRLSTWLAARDLPHTRMASMIDITGKLHYQAKTVPGQRFARLALKYQYGKDIVAEGPYFKNYTVDGRKVIVHFDNAVIQAGQPTPFWGDVPGDSIVRLSFAGIEKVVKVPEGEQGWMVTVPALPASSEPRTLRVSCEIDGELAHEKVITNIVVGDVWFVSAGFIRESLASDPPPEVKVLLPFTKKRQNSGPVRYRLETSGTPGGSHYSSWISLGEKAPRSPASHTAFAYALGSRIHSKTGKPVGVVLMDSRKSDTPISSWIGGLWLNQAPSLRDDYEVLRKAFPYDESYFTKYEVYVNEWKEFWKSFDETVSGRILSEKCLPEGSTFGFPRIEGPQINTQATQSYNMMITSFNPGNFKGILCLTPSGFCKEDGGANFGPELSVLANCWKETFSSGKAPLFFYTMPDKQLAPEITRPEGIKGKSFALPIQHWLEGGKADPKQAEKQLLGILDAVMKEAY